MGNEDASRKVNEYTIFISYRGGNAQSLEFARSLYQVIKNTPNYQQIFGEPFFSPANSFGNFKEDIDKVMKGIKYFVIPYYDGFFDDFLTEGGNPNEESITLLEIESALKQEGMCFVFVYLDGTKPDPKLVKQIFRDKATSISCANQTFYLSSEGGDDAMINLVDEVCTAMAQQEIGHRKVWHKIREGRNITLTFKGNTEDPMDYPFGQRVWGCSKITLVNLAATVFVAGANIADVYKTSDWLKRWYVKSLMTGKIDAILVILDPESGAAQDAVRYKMYPAGLKVKKDQIIRKNLEEILALKMTYKKAKIRVYLTDIALSTGLMRVEYREAVDNYIKVDMYMPLLSNDKRRPSFYLLKQDKDMETMYNFFDDSIDRLVDDSKELVREGMHKWICKQHFAHRATYIGNIPAHTKSAFEQCIIHGVSMEVDIMFPKWEGMQSYMENIIVWRDEMIETQGQWKKLSECTCSEFAEFREKHSEILTLKELLELLELNRLKSSELKQKECGLLIEVKSEMPDVERDVTSMQTMQNQIDSLLAVLKGYKGNLAIHSSNPYVVSYAKEQSEKLGVKILCGQITLDMTEYDVPEYVKEMHKTGACLKISNPDFVSCKVKDIKELFIATYCYRNGKPLLGWGVDAEKVNLNRICDALILDNYQNAEWGIYKDDLIDAAFS